MTEWHPKVWGAEQWLVQTELYTCKILWLEPDFQCSLHRHLVKDETFRVLSGEVKLEVGDETRLLRARDSVRVPPGVWHRFSNHRYGVVAQILEVSTHHDEADVERREPSRRTSGTGAEIGG